MTKLRRYQKEGVRLIDQFDGRALLADEMGLGKAQPLHAKILTPHGWVEMRDVTVGTPVIGKDGRPYQITGVYPRGIRQVFRVTFSDGSSAECCDEHLWAVRCPNRRFNNRPARVRPLKEIRKDLRGTNGNLKHFIDLVQPTKHPTTPTEEIHPYLLGYLLANGCMSNEEGGTPSVTCPDPETASRLAKILPPNITIKQTGDIYYRLPKTGKRSSKENPLTAILRRMGLWGCKSSEKFIPQWCLLSSVKFRKQLLMGLMDGDGWVGKDNHVEYNSSSEQLAQDVQQLIWSLGGTGKLRVQMEPKFTYKGEQKIGLPGWTVTVALPEGITPFKLSRKRNAYHPRRKYPPSRAITKVEKVGEFECRCIRVDAPDNLYITDNYILTHNTIQALTWFDWNFGEDALCIVICPASLKYNWEREASIHINVRAEICNGQKCPKKRNRFLKHRLIIINYDILPYWFDYLIKLKPDLVIIDEGQNIKNPEAQRSIYTTALCEDVPHIIVLSGTPLTNRPAELFPILHILLPKRYKRFQRFAWKFCDPRRDFRGKWEYKGAKNLPLLHKRLKKQCMIRRLKRDVLKELPPISHNIVLLDIKNRKEYDDAEKDFIAWLRTKSAAKANRAAKAQRMLKRQYLRRLIGELKLKAVKEWIDNFFEETDDKLILFGLHKKVLKPLYRHYQTRAVLVDGSVTGRKRQLAVDKFQTSKRTDLFLGNYQAAGTGHTLTAARTVGLIEIPWTPGEVSQAIARAHRMTQTRGVQCFFLVVYNTIEHDLIKLIQHKQGILDSVLDGGVPTSEDDLLDMLDDAIAKRQKKGK